MLMELCGEEALKNVALVTNMWGGVTPQVEESREQELKDKYFGVAIEKGAQLCCHYNTPESARAILREILKNQPVVLKIQRELVDEAKGIRQTGAGAELDREIHMEVGRHQAELRTLEMQMQRARAEGDKQDREELEEDARQIQRGIEKLQRSSANMDTKFEEARHKVNKN